MLKKCTTACLFTALVALSFLFNITANAQCPTLVWADEFNGTTLDGAKWTAENGGGGWGNGELQYYKAANATVGSGTLKITAKKERVQANNYTSARIKTYLKGDWTYGRFEARIKLPKGAGLWPAFWMMPTDSYYGTWPRSGEIDISELVGAKPNNSFGTLHYGTSSTDHQYKGANFFLNSGTFADAFHTFAVEWQAGVIKWYVDDNLYSTLTSADIAPYAWPFDKRFYIILNLAVGGTLGGTVDTKIFPVAMEVDYVRVYAGNTPTISGKRVVLNQAQGETYSIANAPAGSNYNWSVPPGATIASGQGTNSITVNWANTSSSGNVNCAVSSSCGTSNLAMNVYVEPAYNYAFSFVNFDASGQATYSRSDGTYSVVANPSASGINTSALSGKYIRNSTVQYDYIQYNTTAITNAADYKNKVKKFYLDVYTAAPVGTPVLIQLEGSTASATNYPTGRNSRYVAYTTKQNQWERLIFTFLDAPDAAASDAGVTRMLLMFNSNSFTGSTYYIDNLDSYSVGAAARIGEASVTALPVSNLMQTQIYPNPTGNELRIQHIKANTSVSILNLMGQSMGVYKFKEAGNAVIDISSLVSGQYLVKFTSNDETKTLKIIKQ
ncbi:family 16 glycosylhydrolase [Lacibacter sediminis]|uniref:Family 16 glycosylhydrolase n=1 Tax=Lacibacter sediminis TaxID=2760713 RepID=A0A7G5XKN3_9BACT|nr:family 16 glycosylhydrolase [Lacibacter sediminis]QNA46036.1 family 16 glycosylhydrolase [Lacibacter sediminis]